MKKWYPEEWKFEIRVLAVKPDNNPRRCRMGLEVGDMFFCTYECPAGFCSKSLLKLFPIFEAVRSGGDLRLLGGSTKTEMNLLCPDGVVEFEIKGIRMSSKT